MTADLKVGNDQFVLHGGAFYALTGQYAKAVDSLEGVVTRSLPPKGVMAMPQRVVQSPGEPAAKSGQRRPQRGGNEVTVPKGHILPPTAPKGGDWVLVDPTDNQSGR